MGRRLTQRCASLRSAVATPVCHPCKSPCLKNPRPSEHNAPKPAAAAVPPIDRHRPIAIVRPPVWAPVAELVDALDSKSSSARSAGSIPARGTKTRSADLGGMLSKLEHSTSHRRLVTTTRRQRSRTRHRHARCLFTAVPLLVNYRWGRRADSSSARPDPSKDRASGIRKNKRSEAADWPDRHRWPRAAIVLTAMSGTLQEQTQR